MPELPDVEVFRRYLEATALHKRIESVQDLETGLLDGVSANDLRRAIEEHALEETARHGKHLLARIPGDGWLALHFGMTGRLKYHKLADSAPEHVCMRLALENGYDLDYACTRKLGRIGLAASPDALAREQGLGPDALDPGLSGSGFARLLAGRRGMLKTALMDQSLLAGIGNVYSDEILFQLSLHPRTPVDTLDEAGLKRLHATLRQVLEQAVENGADPARMPDTMLTAHRHRDGCCPKCSGKLETIKVSGRSAVFCPACQKTGS
ncbi:Formamidopyrimidine-DNA glycosylase catalytic domain protein [Desulfovibrio sp. X2]|uniref:Fpg/Nei family DNA glycosylase n=1 Tax=Desulfovibrio sp. X2 TaxID=941449 RepID=UPI000358C160|nr:DNA-formamidopyrimidine glycosylase family protein [Desulfovibrio sp. X2]EPR44282.1 Formamidopyrimidine-DNA glycosylase catalytic domain protein [Desulfovibrio sp. X2]